MSSLKSGLFKNGIIIPCFYYEIEKKCIEIVDAYCIESEENKNNFSDFSKHYFSFRPYFDFVVCQLGYCILNPELKPETILYGKENQMFKKEKNDKKEQNFCYGLSDNKTLKMENMPMDSSSILFRDCLIDGDCFHLLPDNMFGHRHIFQQLLNLLLISSEKVCYDFLNYSGDIGLFVQRYLPLLWFQADVQGRNVKTAIVFREDNITQLQRNYMSDLIDNRYAYKSGLLNACEEDKFNEAIDMRDLLKYRDKEIYQKRKF